MSSDRRSPVCTVRHDRKGRADRPRGRGRPWPVTLEWEFVRPLLPESLRGRKRLDDRTVLNGSVWKFRTGTAWRDVPERYGSWHTLHTRFRRWALAGTFERMLRPPRPGRTQPATSTGWGR
ncbi:transposase [Streptomyces sp. NPDC056580]|uniref:transposase n=1 Tax=Streptomyces sp. NPDC056580 TaxID=3345872 RepID=UPI0036AD4F2D